MNKFARLILVASIFIFIQGLAAQSVTSLLSGGAQAPVATSTSADQLGRGTPSGTVLGFLQATQSGNYNAAADYLQMSAAHRLSQGPDMAEKLKVLMDRAFVFREHEVFREITRADLTRKSLVAAFFGEQEVGGDVPADASPI